MGAYKGDKVQLLCDITREAYYKSNGKPGTVNITLAKDTILIAATGELGGNIFAETSLDSGDDVFVPLAEGEWIIV